MSEKRSGCLTVFLIGALVASAAVNFAFLAVSAARSTKPTILAGSRKGVFEEQVFKPSPTGEEGGKRIAVLYIRGVITSAEPGQVEPSSLDDTLLEIEQAREDESVGAVVLRIDSPGGEVTASDILYQAVRKLRDKKPVVVSMDSVAASGGYYVACGGSYIIAHETTITASIGVIMQALHYEQLLDKIGVDVLTFKSGQFKDLLNGARKMTDAERAYLQGMIDQSYGRFVGIVARERKIDEAELRAGVADGRIVSGQDALAAKLVDGVGGLDEALDKARALANAPNASAIRYNAPFVFGRLIRLLSEAPSKGLKMEFNLGGKWQFQMEKGRLYYLPAFYMP